MDVQTSVQLTKLYSDGGGDIHPPAKVNQICPKKWELRSDSFGRLKRNEKCFFNNAIKWKRRRGGGRLVISSNIKGEGDGRGVPLLYGDAITSHHPLSLTQIFFSLSLSSLFSGSLVIIFPSLSLSLDASARVSQLHILS